MYVHVASLRTRFGKEDVMATLCRTWTPVRPIQKASRRVRKTVQARATAEGGGTEEEEGFERRLASLKGKTRPGEGAKAAKRKAKKERGSVENTYDFSNEVVYYEGGPSTGDVATNVALGFTLVWLPLTLASIGRKLFLKYKITDKRVNVISESPFAQSEDDIPYGNVADVVTVGRGVGLWGDMVITCKDGKKVELRSLDKFLEIKAYILEQVEKAKVAKEEGRSKGF